VVLVPHIASSTVQTPEAMGRSVLDNLSALFEAAGVQGSK
jgi:lactate dehydrogenase-like 2-hydroxyacid dehydrogenase